MSIIQDFGVFSIQTKPSKSHWLTRLAGGIDGLAKHPNARYSIEWILNGKRGDRYKYVILPARRSRCSRASLDKYRRHKARPNGRRRGR